MHIILKKNGKKGFTLVEVIVVLVILAILAAIMIPALTGWIDKAKSNQASGDLHLIATAARTAYADIYAKHKDLNKDTQIIYIKGRVTNDKYYNDFTAYLKQYIGDEEIWENTEQVMIVGSNYAVQYKKNGTTYIYRCLDGKITITERN